MPRQKSTHVDDPNEVGGRLRAAREVAGLSQRQLAFPGCSPAYISRIESGDRIPSLQLLRELGRRLGVSADFLATGSDPLEREKTELEAEVALRLGELDLAESLYTTMLETSPGAAGSAVARAGLGQVAFAKGDPRSAIAQLENALEHTEGGLGDLPEVADPLGRAYMLVGELETAIAVFEGALAEAERRGDRLERGRFSFCSARRSSPTGTSIERRRSSTARSRSERTPPTPGCEPTSTGRSRAFLPSATTRRPRPATRSARWRSCAWPRRPTAPTELTACSPA